MDIEIIRSIAPRAQVIDYQLAFGDLAEAINRVVRDGKAKIVSGSFGACDSTKDDKPYSNVSLWAHPAFRKGVESALRAAAAAGVSVFFASGDSGGTACQAFDLTDHNRTVVFPADAPYAVAVGGTVLSFEAGQWYESGWNLSGGGINPYDARPAWQKSTDATVGGASVKRRVPDVSAAAQDWSVYTTWHDTEANTDTTGFQNLGGTSASAPFWAASMLLVQQYMQSHGAGLLCFAAPLLYALDSASWKFPPFYDVPNGSNGVYSAVKGWDFVTGLGTPYLSELADAAVIYRKAHPLPGGANACR
jgi:kumamolisin